MPGPTPKRPELRQRRNKKTTRATFTRESEPRKRAPSLPRREEKWHKLTRAWWNDLWHSPMADEYLRVDEHALFRLAALIDLFWSNPSKELAAEIRLEQQAFGITPLDRRRLEWSIEQVETAQQRNASRRRQGADSDADDLQGRDSDPRVLLLQSKAEENLEVVA